jgi:hypothetical protein
LPLTIWSAPSAHFGVHAPHPLQRFSFMFTIFLFMLVFLF